MICRLDTRGKIQYYFHNQVLTINRLTGLLLTLIRVKFYTLDMLKSAPISLNIMKGRQGGLMVDALNSGASGPGLSPSWGHCVVFLAKTLYSRGASLHLGV